MPGGAAVAAAQPCSELVSASPFSSKCAPCGKLASRRMSASPRPPDICSGHIRFCGWNTIAALLATVHILAGAHGGSYSCTGCSHPCHVPVPKYQPLLLQHLHSNGFAGGTPAQLKSLMLRIETQGREQPVSSISSFEHGRTSTTPESRASEQDNSPSIAPGGSGDSTSTRT